MRVIYFSESKNFGTFWKLVWLKARLIFNIVERKELDGKVIYYLPIIKEGNISRFRTKRLCNRINKMLDKDESNIVALSEYLDSIELFKNYLYSNNIDILSGTFLFKCLSYKVIEYIFKYMEIKPELGEVSILVNDFTDLNRELIIFIAKRIKTLNVVTNHIDKFKNVVEYLYNEYGIILNVSNNRKKSLIKAYLILNLDFPEELVNKYRIYDEALLVNIGDNVNISSKRFNGINISSYRINMPDKFKLSSFSNEIVYESLIYKLGTFEKINKRITNDKITINRFIGNNGFIKEKYLKMSLNVLTKQV